MLAIYQGVDAPRASERKVTCQLKDGSEADDGIEKQRRSPLKRSGKGRYGDCDKSFGQSVPRWTYVGDPHRTAEGGWGVAGTAFGQQEFKALAEKARAKSLREER